MYLSCLFLDGRNETFFWNDNYDISGWHLKKMPACVKANKWAGNLIIVFQLTVWSFVGIVLLQRGIISLRREAEARNAVNTQGSITRRNEKESDVAEASQRIVEEDATQNEPRGNAYPTTGNDVTRIPTKSSMIRKRTTIGRKQDTRDARAVEAETIHAVNKNDDEESRRKENAVDSEETFYGTRKTLTFKLFKLQDSADTASIVRSKEDGLFEEEDIDVPMNKTTDNIESEVTLQRSRASRIGAAVAIIMLAIGVVMLLLGPLIVILRAISDRRRTRQMLKSRCDNDHPPTYEEAVLMDPVPRYSTLQLDTILESSP